MYKLIITNEVNLKFLLILSKKTYTYRSISTKQQENSNTHIKSTEIVKLDNNNSTRLYTTTVRKLLDLNLEHHMHSPLNMRSKKYV